MLTVLLIIFYPWFGVPIRIIFLISQIECFLCVAALSLLFTLCVPAYIFFVRSHTFKSSLNFDETLLVVRTKTTVLYIFEKFLVKLAPASNSSFKVSNQENILNNYHLRQCLKFQRKETFYQSARNTVPKLNFSFIRKVIAILHI